MNLIIHQPRAYSVRWSTSPQKTVATSKLDHSSSKRSNKNIPTNCFETTTRLTIHPPPKKSSKAISFGVRITPNPPKNSNHPSIWPNYNISRAHFQVRSTSLNHHHPSGIVPEDDSSRKQPNGKLKSPTTSPKKP